MNWLNYPLVVLVSFTLWILGTFLLLIPFKRKQKDAAGLTLVAVGILVIAWFIIQLWIHLDRPPMRTLGETRLWYGFFLPVIGYLTFLRWRYRWFLALSLSLASVFLFINYLHPENYDKTLMPALQSPWFVPHVIVYMIAYSLLAASSLVALKGLYHHWKETGVQEELSLADNMVYIGFAFLTLGLLFGALWAKEAWGHYWTWDPKETWAFLTWAGYLSYIHFRIYAPKKALTPLLIISLAFVILLICWFGINYLPAAQNSVHTYSGS